MDEVKTVLPADLHDGLRAINIWLEARSDRMEVYAALAFLNSYWGTPKS